MDNNTTKLASLINPEVMADMVSAKVEKKIRIMPYAKLDTTLQGQAGDTITVPKYGYIGEAVDVAEGEEIPVRKLSVSSDQHKIKKAGIGGTITDEAALSGYGNPVGELNNQMALSIASKCDTDALSELYKAKTIYTSSNIMGYKTVVNAVDVFGEEENSEKAMFIHPNQTTQLRLDPDFIAKDKYGNDVMVNGEIGMVANVRIVPSKKVKDNSTYAKTTDTSISTDKKYFTKNGDEYVEVETPKVADIANYYEYVAGTHYLNPIVKLETEEETEDESPALTVYLKRDTNVETDRISKRRLTEVTGDKMYVVALTNETKVVIAKTLKTAQSV